MTRILMLVDFKKLKAGTVVNVPDSHKFPVLEELGMIKILKGEKQK